MLNLESERGLGGLDEENLRWKKLSTKHLVQDAWIDFREDKYLLPDGRTTGCFYTYSKKDFVIVVARDTEGRFVCVRQYRQGIEKVTTEFPAGGIEQGEEPLACAKRELLEETGYQGSSWTKLCRLPANATISGNYMTIFLAEQCERSGSQKLDETEFVDVVLLSEEALQERIDRDEFLQAAHVLGFLLMKQRES